MPMLESVISARGVGKTSQSSRTIETCDDNGTIKQWGIDIIGEINSNSSLQHKYILMTSDYFTRWVEAIPLRKVNEDAVMDLLQDHIMTRFGVPISLVLIMLLNFLLLD